MSQPIRRLEVGPRLSNIAIHNGTVYLAGQVPDEHFFIDAGVQDALKRKPSPEYG